MPDVRYHIFLNSKQCLHPPVIVYTKYESRHDLFFIHSNACSHKESKIRIQHIGKTRFMCS